VEFTDVIKRRRMVRAFTNEPLPEGTTDRLLRAANRAPSAGFSQGQAYLVLEGAEQTGRLWAIFGDDFAEGTFAKLPNAPLVIVPLANKDVYLDRYAEQDKGWTDRDEAHWPVPYWYIDTGMAALLVLLQTVDDGLGALFFGIPPEDMDEFRGAFNVPEVWTPIGAVAVGYPDLPKDPGGSGTSRPRKSLEDLVHRAAWLIRPHALVARPRGPAPSRRVPPCASQPPRALRGQHDWCGRTGPSTPLSMGHYRGYSPSTDPSTGL
jgi:nitroreductase